MIEIATKTAITAAPKTSRQPTGQRPITGRSATKNRRFVVGTVRAECPAVNAMLHAMDVGIDRIRRISRRDYHRMAEVGILREDERLELLYGVIVHKHKAGESGPVVTGGIRLDDVRKLSRHDYHRMAEVGILGADEHVELVHGLVVAMSPMSELHSYLVVWLTRAFVRQLDDSFDVRPQVPLSTSNHSEPEPDLAITSRARVHDEHPSTAHLVIEIAASSLLYDREYKLPVYARARVPEYWIVDLETNTVEVYTKPKGGRYTKLARYRDGDTLRPQRLPQATIAVGEIPFER
jgi:Uma2 family endonuclease